MVRQNASLTGNCLLTIVKGSSLDLSCIGMGGRKTLIPFWVPTATSHSKTLSIILTTTILVPFLRLLLGPPEISTKDLKWSVDKESMVILDAAITDAEENFGESELRDALLISLSSLLRLVTRAWEEDGLGVPHHQDWSLLHRPQHHQDQHC